MNKQIPKIIKLPKEEFDKVNRRIAQKRNSLIKKMLSIMVSMRLALLAYQYFNAYCLSKIFHIASIYFPVCGQIVSFPYKDFISLSDFMAHIFLQGAITAIFVVYLSREYNNFINERRAILYQDKKDFDNTPLKLVFIGVAVEFSKHCLEEVTDIGRFILRNPAVSIFLQFLLLQIVIEALKKSFDLLNEEAKYLLQKKSSVNTNNKTRYKFINTCILAAIPAVIGVIAINIFNKIRFLADLQVGFNCFGINIICFNNINNKFFASLVTKIAFDIVYRYCDLNDNSEPHLPRRKKSKDNHLTIVRNPDGSSTEITEKSTETYKEMVTSLLIYVGLAICEQFFLSSMSSICKSALNPIVVENHFGVAMVGVGLILALNVPFLICVHLKKYLASEESTIICLDDINDGLATSPAQAHN